MQKIDTKNLNELSAEEAKILEEKMIFLRKARRAELEKLLVRTSALTSAEYLELLEEIRKNFTAYLAMMSVSGDFKNCGAASTIIERVHWLIDSAEKKTAPKEKWITEWKKYEEKNEVSSVEQN